MQKSMSLEYEPSSVPTGGGLLSSPPHSLVVAKNQRHDSKKKIKYTCLHAWRIHDEFSWRIRIFKSIMNNILDVYRYHARSSSYTKLTSVKHGSGSVLDWSIFFLRQTSPECVIEKNTVSEKQSSTMIARRKVLEEDEGLDRSENINWTYVVRL